MSKYPHFLPDRVSTVLFFYILLEHLKHDKTYSTHQTDFLFSQRSQTDPHSELIITDNIICTENVFSSPTALLGA